MKTLPTDESTRALVARLAKVTEEAIASADLTHPSEQKVPYTGIQYVAIPEFQAIGVAGSMRCR